MVSDQFPERDTLAAVLHRYAQHATSRQLGAADAVRHKYRKLGHQIARCGGTVVHLTRNRPYPALNGMYRALRHDSRTHVADSYLITDPGTWQTTPKTSSPPPSRP